MCILDAHSIRIDLYDMHSSLTIKMHAFAQLSLSNIVCTAIHMYMSTYIKQSVRMQMLFLALCTCACSLAYMNKIKLSYEYR